ncbi:MAG: ribonuclease E/G, partial [Thermoleophilum sp.]|nr:ribonuclease E/G [Thermoleophilum sp.]
WIVRTAAQGTERGDFEREILYLRMLYDILRERAERADAPALVFQEADLPVRVVRDIFSSEFERALVDDQKAHERLVSFLSRTAPDLVDRVELDSGEPPLFERFGVERALRSTLERRVDLPSGGYLVFDYAEAMTVIDVNSGSFTGRGKGARLEDTITKTNLEAAEEIVRQLRLRDIGGIIVIDFIDMARARNRDAVLRRLREALERDRTKTYVVEVSPLGLVEMTRQNVTEGVRGILTKPCPTCAGEGVVLSEETVALQAARWLRETAFAHPGAEALLVRMHPRVSALLTRSPDHWIDEIEAETGKRFHFEGTEALPIDHMEVVAEGTLDEIAERALPFREGDEVFVELVEPHMYNEDDAVAKLDGYVVAVRGAAGLVGQKVLVRIERVGRSSAEATLVAEGSASGDSDRADGGATRRGGRRARRRSAASA